MLDSIIDSSCTDEQREEFSGLLDDNPHLADRVIAQLSADAMLKWAESPSLTGLDPSECRRELVALPEAPSDGPTAYSSRRLYLVWAATALAASLMGAAALFWGTPADVAFVGELRPIGEIEWADGSTALVGGGQLSTGLLDLKSGSVAIELVNGVEMRLNAPTRCSIDSEMLVHLLHGQATANVPRWARGFTIATSDVEVVDLGTRFGVAKLDDGQSDVVVFEGEVDLKSVGAAEKRFARRLTQGEAARINRRGEIDRIFQVHGEANSDNWSTFQRFEQQPIIADVFDNLGPRQSVGYYQVIQRGLDEDAHAYVDHPHEWNGLDAGGLPDFLRGADYVRTVNDYRYVSELAIQVEIAADANLYVMFDNRTKTPEWLLSQFEDTGVDVGLDEDAWDGNPTFTVSTGAGQSIDNTFSVYRRACAAGETFVLGSMGAGSEARAMYGVAATLR